MKKRIAVIANADELSGVGSRAFELISHIGEQEDLEIVPVMLDGKEGNLSVRGTAIKHVSHLPGFLGSKSISWVRLAKYIPEFDIYDLSNQTLSFIAKKRHPSIVTVHDIIELTDPQEPRAKLLNQYLMSGISRADKIVAVSEYTKQAIQSYFGIPESAITVIYNGVDAAYQPIENFSSTIAYQELRRELKLSKNHPIILSVGSDHPRKNMETILKTVALLKKQYPNIILLKVGEAGVLSGRVKTLRDIDALGLIANVRFLGTVSKERLNELYNLADALLFPSRQEGFGMPPIEAMAASCPVFCSNATSLPEIVGEGAIMHKSEDAEAYATSISYSIRNADFRNTLIQKGLEQSKRFSWHLAAEKTLALYRVV